MQGKLSDDRLPDGPAGPIDGWNEIESELLAMIDRTLADFRGDPQRVYLTGLSYGGFGAWSLAARHPERFAALAPIVGYGHPDHAESRSLAAKLPVWCFAGGRDPVVASRFFYPVLNKLEKRLDIPRCASPITKTSGTSPGCACTAGMMSTTGCWGSRADPHARFRPPK